MSGWGKKKLRQLQKFNQPEKSYIRRGAGIKDLPDHKGQLQSPRQAWFWFPPPHRWMITFLTPILFPDDSICDVLDFLAPMLYFLAWASMVGGYFLVVPYIALVCGEHLSSGSTTNTIVRRTRSAEFEGGGLLARVSWGWRLLGCTIHCNGLWWAISLWVNNLIHR